MPETLINTENITADKQEPKSELVVTAETPPAAKEELSNKQETATEAAATTKAADTTSPNYELNKFQLDSILNNNTRNKSIVVLGKFPDLSKTDKAIVIFEKQAFKECDVATTKAELNDAKNGKEENGNEQVKIVVDEEEKPSYFCHDLKVQTEFINNIYGSYQCTPPAKLSDVKVTVVYPATDKHIEKYSICQKYLINETPQLYEEVTLPYLTTSQFSLEWVYNILEHKQETERIIFEDPDPETGFVLLPDLKWDGRNVETLYVLAIAHKHDIKSLRDLNASHLPLLRNIRLKTAETIENQYGLVVTQLRMYFHYQPSFYHLHVHINPVRNDAPGIWCEKSHMLDTVINNLELLSDYYQKATLPFVLYDGNKLLELYETKVTVRKAAKCLADTTEELEEIKAKKQKIMDEETNIKEAIEVKAVTE